MHHIRYRNSDRVPRKASDQVNYQVRSKISYQTLINHVIITQINDQIEEDIHKL